jgi:hypothetical protein
MLRCTLTEELESSGQCQYISHRTIVTNVFSNNIIFAPVCLHGRDAENFAFTFDNLRKPCGDNEPYHILKLLQPPHFASLNTHTFSPH